MKKWIRIKRVREKVPVAASTIWAWVKEGKFPEPTRLSTRCTVWDEGEVDRWMEQAGMN